MSRTNTNLPANNTHWLWGTIGVSLFFNLFLVAFLLLLLQPPLTRLKPTTAVQVGQVVINATATPGVRPTPEGDVRLRRVSVVLAWKRTVSRLETKEYDLVADAVAPRMGGFFGWGGESIQVHVPGTVVGRTDLSAMTINPDLKTGDITISPDGKTISIVLPYPEISKPIPNEEQTSFNNHTISFFTSSDPNLFQEGRALASKMLVEKACEQGILEDARQEAEEQVRTIFSIGFDTVYVQTKPPTTACM